MQKYLIMTCLALWSMSGLVADEEKEFNPKDLSDLVFFVESIQGIQVTTNGSDAARQANNENCPLTMSYADIKTFPHGCVRRWQDQSPYKNAKKREGYDGQGRDFGQDDLEKPGYIPDGCNGLPSVRGGFDPHQPRYLEIEWDQGFMLEKEFSLIILAKPVKQDKDWTYCGHDNYALWHCVKDNSLMLKTWGGFYLPTKISVADAVKPDQWYLIEVYRNSDNEIQVFVNGKDVTVAKTPQRKGKFGAQFYLASTKGHPRPSMYGDIAAVIVYKRSLDDAERTSVRHYLDSIYQVIGETAKRDVSVSNLIK